ncbi:hypothetical protein Barb6_03942 [Bacteroidales bacterium Barb6]|nr:hypothetical protein Barb6_03942 [Bacteroidales bacterium Barb6]
MSSFTEDDDFFIAVQFLLVLVDEVNWGQMDRKHHVSLDPT